MLIPAFPVYKRADDVLYKARQRAGTRLGATTVTKVFELVKGFGDAIVDDKLATEFGDKARGRQYTSPHTGQRGVRGVQASYDK